MKELKAKRFLLYFVTFFYWFGQYVYVHFLTPYLTGTLGITASFAGTIVGAYGVTQLIIRLPIGLMADVKQKHRLFIFLGGFMCAMGSLVCRLSVNPYVLFCGRALSGVASSMWISFTILNSTYYDPSELSKSLGTINAMNNAGILSGYIAGGILYGKFGMNLLFSLSIGAGGIAAVAALFVKNDPATRSAPSVKELLPILKQKRLIAFAVCGAVFQFISFATANSFSNSFIKSAGVSDFELSVCSALFTLAGMLSSYFVGTKTAAKIGEKWLCAVGFGLLAIYVFILPFLTSFTAIAMVQFMGGCGSTSVFSMLMSCAIHDVPAHQRSTAMGFYQSVYSLGVTLGPAIMGGMIDAMTLQPAFICVGALSMVFGIAFPFIYKFAVSKKATV